MSSKEQPGVKVDNNEASEASQKTHFGFEQVRTEDKAERVAGVFHSVASKYDLMNDLMSGGVHRLWKRFTIEISGVTQCHKVLYSSGGTGDLSYNLSRFHI